MGDGSRTIYIDNAAGERPSSSSVALLSLSCGRQLRRPLRLLPPGVLSEARKMDCCCVCERVYMCDCRVRAQEPLLHFLGEACGLAACDRARGMWSCYILNLVR